MVLIFNKVWYPHNKVNEMTKKYLEVSKKYPPDKSISTTVIIAVKSTKEGVEVIGIGDVVKGKFDEAMTRTAASNLEYTSIEGFQYEIDVYMELSEAMTSLLKITPPDYK